MDWLEEGKEAYQLGDYETALIYCGKAVREGNKEALDLAACMYKSGKCFSCEGNRARVATLVFNHSGFASEVVARNFCRIANKFKSKIEMYSQGMVITVKSERMLFIGGLQGNKIDICAEGEDAEQAVRSLADYLFNSTLQLF